MSVINHNNYRRLCFPVIFREFSYLPGPMLTKCFSPRKREYFKIYSDEFIPVKKRMLIEIIYSVNKSLRCIGNVGWVKKLSKDAEAKYDIGICSLAILGDKEVSLSDCLLEENNPNNN